jgi:hypothetical protein
MKCFNCGTELVLAKNIEYYHGADHNTVKINTIKDVKLFGGALIFQRKVARYARPKIYVCQNCGVVVNKISKEMAGLVSSEEI